MRKNFPRWIILHHPAIDLNIQRFQFDVINNYHRQRYNFQSSLGLYGAYHYLIEHTGEIKQYRVEEEEGCHTRGMNSSSIGICMAGNFSLPGRMPTVGQIKSLKVLMKEIMNKYEIPQKRIVPHRFFKNTDCYGKNLPDLWGQMLIERDKHQVKIELLKKKIGIIEKLIQLYIKILNIFKGRRN